MEVFLIILLAILVLSILICFIALIKNDVTYKQRTYIIAAIYLYSRDKIHKNEPREVSYDDMESYDATFYRWWDWGYTHILPKDKFEIVKSYLDVEEEG